MTQNGINFTINNEPVNIIKNKISIDSYTKLNAGKVTPIINAVAIDWNNAEVDENTVINTTGELIAWIKNEINKVTSNKLNNEQQEALNYIVNMIKNIKRDNEQLNNNYYFYTGVIKPTSDDNPEDNLASMEWKPVSNNGKSRYPGWRLIGNRLDNISESNPVYNGGMYDQCINIDENFNNVYYYIALPVELGLYDSDGNNYSNQYLIESNVTIAGHQYNIYKDYNSDVLFIIY